jgi:hypothetical protein
MEGTATPRVTASYLSSYIGKNVIVVGKVIQLRGDEATLDAEGTINAHLNRVSLNIFIPSATKSPNHMTRMPTSRQETGCKLSAK